MAVDGAGKECGAGDLAPRGRLLQGLSLRWTRDNLRTMQHFMSTVWIAAVVWVLMLLAMEAVISGRVPPWLKTAMQAPPATYLSCVAVALLYWLVRESMSNLSMVDSGPQQQPLTSQQKNDAKPAAGNNSPSSNKAIVTSDNKAGDNHAFSACFDGDRVSSSDCADEQTASRQPPHRPAVSRRTAASCTARHVTLDDAVALDSALQHSSEQQSVRASAPALRRLRRMSMKTPTQAFSEVPANAGTVLVLYVDSSPIDQAVMNALLGNEPAYKLMPATTGRQALDLVFQSQWLPDIVLIDVMLPDMKASEVCSTLRAVYSPVELPVLLLSSRSGEADMLAALEGGQVNDFLLKPLLRLELMARLNSQMMIKSSVKREAESRSHYDLLVQVLPPHIIQRLAAGQAYVPEQHEQVTILFSDIVGFTTLSALWPTQEVVAMLDMLFGAFDDLCDRHGVFKVETIGDAYMVVAGHDGSKDHSLRMAAMAVDMLAAAEDTQYQLMAQGKEGRRVQIRIGMHTGPAHSGVVGKRRPRYCFFGDTVNTASRMESTGYPMAVHLSEACAHSMIAAAAAAPAEAAGRGNAVDDLAGASTAGAGALPWDLIDMGWTHVKGKGKMKTSLMRSCSHASNSESHCHAATSRLQVGEWLAALSMHRARQLQQQHDLQYDYSSTCSTCSPVSPPSPTATEQYCDASFAEYQSYTSRADGVCDFGLSNPILGHSQQVQHIVS